MSERTEQFLDGLQHFATIVGWLLAGSVLGSLLANWQAPESQLAIISSALLFPATVLLGWMMMFPLALLMLPFMIPGFIRWLRDPLAKPGARPPRSKPGKAHAGGWVFVAAAIPTSLVAGFIAGAPFIYLLGGLLYGYALRRSTALLEVGVA